MENRVPTSEEIKEIAELLINCIKSKAAFQLYLYKQDDEYVRFNIDLRLNIIEVEFENILGRLDYTNSDYKIDEITTELLRFWILQIYHMIDYHKISKSLNIVKQIQEKIYEFNKKYNI